MPVSTGRPGLRPTSRVESPPAPVGTMGDDWFDTSVDEFLENSKGDTHRCSCVPVSISFFTGRIQQYHMFLT